MSVQSWSTLIDSPAEACARVRRWLRPAGASNTPPDIASPSPPVIKKDMLLRSSSNASRHAPKFQPPKPITPPRSYSFDGLSSMTATPVSATTSLTMTVSPPPPSSVTSIPPSTGGSVPFPRSARTTSTSSRPMSPPDSTISAIRPRSPGPGLTSFPAYSNRTPPTSAMHTELVVGESTASPTSPVRPTHRSQSSVASIARWFSYTPHPANDSVQEPTPAVSNLMQLADDNRISGRSSGSGHDGVDEHRRPSLNLGRTATSPHVNRPTLHVVHDNNTRRKSEEWTSRMSGPWTSATSPAEALSEFGEGVKKKQSGELLTGSIHALPPRAARSRGGSLGRDSRLYGDDPQPQALWGVDVEGVRVGECSALTGEGGFRVSLLSG